MSACLTCGACCASYRVEFAVYELDELGGSVPAALTEPASLDELAADYAAIYLNNSLGASPYESVWLSDDHLACAAPMFELRELYAAAGLRVADWRSRFDDHFVLQLQYLQHLLHVPAEGRQAASFIDEHVGYWFPDFAQRVSLFCATSFYAALAELTHVWLLRLRGLLGTVERSGLDVQLAPILDIALDPTRQRLVLDVGGYYKNVITFAPSLMITRPEIDEAMVLLDQLLTKAKAA